MLFATHHTIKKDNKLIPIAYIGSICTVEEERGKGLATLLMKKAEEELKTMGKRGFILIAAHEGLVPFYETRGYQLCGKEGIIIKNTFNEEKLKDYQIEKAKDFDYNLIEQIQKERNNCIIHNKETLKLYTITDYDIINLYKENTLVAQGVVIPDFSPIEVLDCFCFEKQTCEIFSEMIYRKHKKEVRLKHFPMDNQITSTIEMSKNLTPEIFMSLNLDT